MSKKKLLLLSSYGGHCHTAAANTFISLLGKEYEIDVVYPIKELRVWGVPSGESIYDFLISKNLYRLTNWVAGVFAPWVFKSRQEKTRRLIDAHIKEKKADMVISLIPFINFPMTEAAKKVGIPSLLVIMDHDLSTWIFALKKQRYPNFKVTIGANLSATRHLLNHHGIPDTAIEALGLPLRPTFLKTKTKEQLRIEYGIPEEKPVILLMMGGVGARSIIEYTKRIVHSNLNVHLFVCAGKKKKLAKKLKKIKPKNHNTFEVIPFTENVGELFAVSDLMITKPGTGTINEAFALKLPLLIDRTQIPLFWEQPNIDLVLNYKVGACVDSLSDLTRLIKQFLFDEQVQEEILRAYENVPSNRFAQRIKPLIEEMCGEAAAKEKAASKNISGTCLS